ncbi:hypothetical protein ACFLYF_01680 [Chloroflexota bacterium]
MNLFSEIENFKIPPSRITVNKSFAETFAKELVDAYFSEKSKAVDLNANDRLSSRPLSKPAPDKATMEASKWLAIMRHPLVAVVLGKKGSGKSGLGYRLCEHLKDGLLQSTR